MSADRAAFEAYFASSRRSRGRDRAPTFERRPDDTYADAHVQRHWWTWQCAMSDEAKNAARYRWAKPILRGDDDETGDTRALILAGALMNGVDIDAAIDAAVAFEGREERGAGP